MPHSFLVYMSSPSKKISIVVISYAVPPEAVQLREGFSISFQCSKSFRGCASELGVNSGSWGLLQIASMFGEFLVPRIWEVTVELNSHS